MPRVDRSVYENWRATLNDAIRRTLKVEVIGGNNYWVAMRAPGGVKKFSCRVPPGVISARRVKLAGSGHLFEGKTKDGNRQATLCVEPSVIRESLIVLHDLGVEDELPFECKDDYDFLLEEAMDFVAEYVKFRVRVLELMYDAGVLTTVHADNVVNGEVALMRADDERNGEKYDDKYYHEFVGTPKDRYVANGLCTPKKDKNSGLWDYCDVHDIPAWASSRIQVRRKAWLGIYPRSPEIKSLQLRIEKAAIRHDRVTETKLLEEVNVLKKQHVVKELADAKDRAQRDINLCELHNDAARRATAQIPLWSHETADDQLDQCLLRKEQTIFQPLLVKTARTNKVISCPWDGCVISEGDLISCELSFKITKYAPTSMAYLRDIFDDITLHFQTGQQLEALGGDRSAAPRRTEAEYIAAPVETSTMDQEFVFPTGSIIPVEESQTS